jgi:hypothetical protein|tara:strand:- start:275 stop:562 length:288 start_codon:yes stop_codon:yes gene_type:complete
MMMFSQSEKQSTGQELITNFIMIRAKSPETTEIVIDLTGPDGNAYSLMATARHYANMIGGKLVADDIVNEMMAGDYENLIKVFDKYFGYFIILER